MTDSNGLVLVITTVESLSDADSLAQALVGQSLAACVQIDGPITSLYRWAGKVEQANEFRLMIKTSLSAWPDLKERLAKSHPYDEPEIIMLPITDATDENSTKKSSGCSSVCVCKCHAPSTFGLATARKRSAFCWVSMPSSSTPAACTMPRSRGAIASTLATS